MSSNHFVVSQRDSVWQFSYRGDVTAPFPTKDAAVEAAIAEAAVIEDAQIEVLVRDADLRTETVWRSGQLDLSDAESERLAAEIDHDNDA